MAEQAGPDRQLPLSLPHEAATGRADFIAGRANAAALALVDRWPDWPERGVLLVGPEGSGKTHLAEIWRRASGATRVAASELSEAGADRAAFSGAVAVEDLHAGPVDERALFHLLNLAGERGGKLLATSRVGPAALRLTLPDLVSRLRALHLVELGAPDDDLLRRVLTKLFADRQLAIDPAVVDFIAVRMERSLAAANRIVAALDRAGLAAGRAVTRRLAAEVLGQMDGGQGDFWAEMV
jgi:chromosomal replication initiation ATPase DnaA